MQNTRVVGFLLDTYKQLQLSDGPLPRISTRTIFLLFALTAGSELARRGESLCRVDVSYWSNWFQDLVLKTSNGPPYKLVLRVPFQAYQTMWTPSRGFTNL